MTKLFLTAVFVIGMIGISFAQSIDGIDFKDIKGDYIILKVDGYTTKGKSKFDLQYGDNGRGLKKQRSIVKDSSGEIVESISSVSILNFLTENGYTLISFNVDRVGSALGYTYLLKRNLTKD